MPTLIGLHIWPGNAHAHNAHACFFDFFGHRIKGLVFVLIVFDTMHALFVKTNLMAIQFLPLCSCVVTIQLDKNYYVL